MKYLISLLIFTTLAHLGAAVSDYETEFGFPLDKPRYSQYHYLRQLLSIEQDPQIITFKPEPPSQPDINLIESGIDTVLDNYPLSDSTMVVDTDALNDLDLFTSLILNSSLNSLQTKTDIENDFSFKVAEPADYNLYIKMDIPPLNPKNETEIEFVPVTEHSRIQLALITPHLQNLSYQIDHIFENENMIIPQSGKIDFVITIEPQGVTAVEPRFFQDSRFSNSFISKCRDTISRWQISSPVKVQYLLSRNYLARH
jgi:hypothetical protein